VKTVANIFALFSQPSEIHGLASGTNRFCKQSFVYSQLTHVTERQTNGRTDRQTDRKVISIAEHTMWPG